MEDTNPNSTEKVVTLLEGFSTVMFLTRHPNGTAHARPMAIARRGIDLEIDFVTDLDSAKVQEIATDTVSQVIAQKDDSVYLSLTGTASFTQDRERLQEVWHECLRVWYPDGVDDPNICLITFKTLRAEYWNHAGRNKLLYLWEAAKAYMAGERVQTGGNGAHGVVKL